MMLDTIQQILNILTPIIAIVGVVIALFEFHNQSRLRQFDTVMRLFTAFGEETFQQHYRRITIWEYDNYETFKMKGTENDHVSLMIVSIFYENMATASTNANLPPSNFWTTSTQPPSSIRGKWSLKPIWFGLRAEYNQPQWVEYYEMLAEDMLKRIARLEAFKRKNNYKKGSTL